jgi:hypothetical protein
MRRNTPDKSCAPVGVCPLTSAGTSRAASTVNTATRWSPNPPSQISKPKGPRSARRSLRRSRNPEGAFTVRAQGLAPDPARTACCWIPAARRAPEHGFTKISFNRGREAHGDPFSETAPGSCARDWRGAQQPRSGGTRPGAEGPERVSAKPRKARFFAEPSAGLSFP